MAEDTVVRDPSASREAMAAVLVDEAAVDAVLQLLVSLARASVDGADEVSVSSACSRDLETISASSDDVRELDGRQYSSGEGPCVAAIADGRVHNVALATARAGWPNFAPEALAQGYGSILSIPLHVRDRTIGALNLYSRCPTSYEDADTAAAQVFAEHASVVLANAMAYSAVEAANRHLETALDSARIIGRAQGVLMARQSCTSQEAFDMLRRASQRSNRKLREIAEDIVAPLETSAQAPS